EDVSEDVAVGKGDAFRFAGAAAGEEEGAFAVAAGAGKGEPGGEETGRENRGGGDVDESRGFSGGGDFGGDVAGIGGPRDVFGAGFYGFGGDDGLETGLGNGTLEGGGSGGEVEIDGSFSGEDAGEVGDGSADSGREGNADAVAGDFAFQAAGEEEDESEEGGAGDFFTGWVAIDDRGFPRGFFERMEEFASEVALELGAFFEGFVAEFEE